MSDPLSDVHVAFFRNLNLGQARSNSPTSAVLREAFLTAGAGTATNFQTNGTVIFTAADPAAVVSAMLPLLTEASGYSDAVIVRPAEWLAGLAARLDPTTTAGEVSLFDATGQVPIAPGWVDPSGCLTVLDIDSRHAVTSWSDRSHGSSANPVLTRLLGVPVTCRGIPTMIRLAGRLPGGR
jgi:hypothetical protein